MKAKKEIRKLRKRVKALEELTTNHLTKDHHFAEKPQPIAAV